MPESYRVSITVRDARDGIPAGTYSFTIAGVDAGSTTGTYEVGFSRGDADTATTTFETVSGGGQASVAVDSRVTSVDTGPVVAPGGPPTDHLGIRSPEPRQAGVYA